MRLQSILRPERIALIGGDPSSAVGRAVLQNIDDFRCWDKVVPISLPGHGSDMWPGSLSLDRLGHDITTAFVLADQNLVVPAIETAADCGVNAFYVLEGSVAGRRASRKLKLELRRIRDEREVSIVGPGTPGVVDRTTGIAAYVGHTGSPHLGSGGISIVSQSGAVLEALLASRQFEIATALGVGLEADVDVSELLYFFAADPCTHTVLAFLEGVDDGQEFLRAARSLASSDTQLCVLKGGSSSPSSAHSLSHTGQLAGSPQVWSQALRDVQAVQCETIEELATVGHALRRGSRKWGSRVHAVTYSGAEGQLFVNEAERVGLQFPTLTEAGLAELRERWPDFPTSNPVDAWDWDPSITRAYGLALDVLAREPGDVVAVIMGLQADQPEWLVEAAVTLARLGGRQAMKEAKPVVFVNPMAAHPPAAVTQLCESYGVPVLNGAAVAAHALVDRR